MKDLERILNEIQRKIQDESYSRKDELMGFINDGIREVASEVVLPDLLTYDTVTCQPDQFSVSVPEDLFSSLLWAYNLDKDRMVHVYGSLTVFLERYASGMQGLSDTGDVKAVCRHGRDLYYAFMPQAGDAQDLRLWYAASPTLLKTGDEDISFIPEQFHARLFVNYACMKVFEEIEEDQRQPQVEKYFQLYSKAKAALINFVGLPERAPSFVPNYEDPWTAVGTLHQDYLGQFE